MLLFSASSVKHILTYDDTYEQLELKGKLEVMLGLTENEQINKHWLEVGKSVIDFTLTICCVENENEVSQEPKPIKVYGHLSFKRNSEANGGGTAYMNSRNFNKLCQLLSSQFNDISIPLGELGTNYTKSDVDSFDCKIQMDFSQISIKLN